MKNVNKRTIGFILVVALLVCSVVTPALTVSADRNIYSYLDEKALGVEWDAWNSMNDTNFDESGYKIPTAEYIEVVNDPTNSGRGGVLKIGHADYDTSLSLRVTQETTVNYSHKLETLLYLDGEFSYANILIRDRDIWDNSVPYDQSNIALNNMEKGKWVTINTENVAAGIDGLSGRSNHHIHDGTITVIFDIVLKKGNYLYIDDLMIAAGNSKTYQKNIDVSKGDKIIYSHAFDTFESIDSTPVTAIDDWSIGSDSNIGKVTANGNTELVIRSGSIYQKIDGLPNGKYNISIDYSTNGNTTAILSAHDITSTGWLNQRNLLLQTVSYGMKTATMNGYTITDNCLRISVWVGAQEGKAIKIDNITVTKEDSNENVVLNGGFELADTPISKPTEKASRAVGWGNWFGSGLSKDSIFIAKEGYNSNSAMAVTYPVDGGSNFNQTIKNLTGGKTYVITARVKMSEAASPTLFIKNYGGGQTSVALPKSQTWTTLYKEFTLPETATQFTLEFYCGGKSGDWFMVDDIKVIDKDGATMTNLVINGDFEFLIGDVDGDSNIKGSDLVKIRSSILDATDIETALADINGNGMVDALDVVFLKKYIAGENVVLGK